LKILIDFQNKDGFFFKSLADATCEKLEEEKGFVCFMDDNMVPS
jgi:hypothetical protein